MNIEAELVKDNPSINLVTLAIYADALTVYLKASENISRNGSICSHPRTGTPIENPYLKVQSHAATLLTKYRNVKSDRVLQLMRATI